MIRSIFAICLVAMGAILCGCSNGYYVDLAELRKRHPATAQDGPRVDVSRRRDNRATVIPATVMPAAGSPSATTGVRTIGHGDEARPWPNRGTPEWDRLQADEAEREKRIEQTLRSICRGC